MFRTIIIAIFAMTLATTAQANSFRQIGQEAEFLSAIEGRKLTRLGIALDVTRSGEIRGRAFGRPVTGAWRWEGGYFCRDLYWGQQNLGANCQAVKLAGETIRFISDQGTGQYADLRLE